MPSRLPYYFGTEPGHNKHNISNNPGYEKPQDTKIDFYQNTNPKFMISNVIGS